MLAEKELRFVVDRRLGGHPCYRLTREDDLMRVPDQIRKCAVFVACRDKNGNVVPRGTAFQVLLPLAGDYNFGYLVTAKHVIKKVQATSADDKVLLRVNTPEGGNTYVETDVSEWRFHPDDESVDVAILPLRLANQGLETLGIPVEGMAVTPEIIEAYDIGAGDEVFITGLFANHYGEHRNLPIVRTGNIALMSDEKVYGGEMFGWMDAHLIESRSMGGLSGSPVFVFMGVSRLNEKTKRLATYRGNLFYWLGLIHGHFDTAVDDDNEDRAFDNERINKGIAIVVPASKILEVINQKEFAEIREKTVADILKRNAPTMDVADATEPMGDFTKRDFEDALRKTSRKSPKKREPPK